MLSIDTNKGLTKLHFLDKSCNHCCIAKGAGENEDTFSLSKEGGEPILFSRRLITELIPHLLRFITVGELIGLSDERPLPVVEERELDGKVGKYGYIQNFNVYTLYKEAEDVFIPFCSFNRNDLDDIFDLFLCSIKKKDFSEREF